MWFCAAATASVVLVLANLVRGATEWSRWQDLDGSRRDPGGARPQQVRFVRVGWRRRAYRGGWTEVGCHWRRPAPATRRRADAATLFDAQASPVPGAGRWAVVALDDAVGGARQTVVIHEVLHVFPYGTGWAVRCREAVAELPVRRRA